MRAFKISKKGISKNIFQKSFSTKPQFDDKKSIITKYERVREFQKKWAKDTTVTQRKVMMEKFRDMLQADVDSVATMLTKETGKPISQSVNEVKGCKARLDFFINCCESVLAPKKVQDTGSVVEEVRREPLGVVANISAWNYPLFVGLNVLIPALLAGNGVLYKPSEHSAGVGGKVVSLLQAAGFSSGVLEAVQGGREAGEAIVALPKLDGLFFTGSAKTGLQISKSLKDAGNLLTKVQLELGGKDPIYVHSDVDVQKVAAATADGAFYNTGQGCCSVERIYVHKSVYEEYVRHFVEEVKGFKMGDPLSKDTYIGPLTLPNQPAFLEEQVRDALSKGATALVGGKRAPIPGNFFEPTVLVGVSHSMSVMRDESFGPIVGIMSVDSPDHAAKLMDDTEYGLTAGVYSKDLSVFERVVSGIESGSAYWNCCDRVSPRLPWVGRRNSGVGLTLSEEGLTTFTVPRGFHLVKN